MTAQDASPSDDAVVDALYSAPDSALDSALDDALDGPLNDVRQALALCRRLIHSDTGADADAASGAASGEPADDPSAPATMAPPQELQALQASLAQASQALSAAGQPMPARVLGTCASAASRLGEVPIALARQAAGAIERALQEVLQPPPGAVPGGLEWALALFASYSAVAHLAGAQRVHPAELWPARSAQRLADVRDGARSTAGLASPREPTHSLLAEFEEALLALMRQPGPAAHARMTQLCADMAAGQAFVGSAVWPLAAAVYEAQRDDRLKTDVQLKRLGSRLLSMLRAAAGYGPAVPAQQVGDLEHEMSFACARALWLPAASDSRPGPWLRAVQQALDLQPLPAPSSVPPGPPPNQPLNRPPSQAPGEAPGQASSQASSQAAGLAQHVAGLPSMADLDPSTWDDAAPAPAEDSVRLIGPLRLDIEPLNLFLNEADERSRRLQMQLSEWVLESVEGVLQPPAQAALDARWLAERSALIGHAELSQFAATMAEAIARLQLQPLMDPLLRGAQARILDAAARELDRVLHQFAAGFLKPASEQVLEGLRSLGSAQAVAATAQAAHDAVQQSAQALATLALLWRNARGRGIGSADEAALAAIDTALEIALLRAEAARTALGPNPAVPARNPAARSID